MNRILIKELYTVNGGQGDPISEGWEAGLEIGNVIGKKFGEFISIWKYFND